MELARANNIEEAIKLYRKALEYWKANADAHVALGAAYVKQMKLKEAKAEFKTALEIDPQHSTAPRYLKATREKVCGPPGKRDRGGRC